MLCPGDTGTCITGISLGLRGYAMLCAVGLESSQTHRTMANAKAIPQVLPGSP